jgi:hypothetical protein
MRKIGSLKFLTYKFRHEMLKCHERARNGCQWRVFQWLSERKYFLIVKVRPQRWQQGMLQFYHDWKLKKILFINSNSPVSALTTRALMVKTWHGQGAHPLGGCTLCGAEGHHITSCSVVERAAHPLQPLYRLTFLSFNLRVSRPQYISVLIYSVRWYVCCMSS